MKKKKNRTIRSLPKIYDFCVFVVLSICNFTQFFLFRSVIYRLIDINNNVFIYPMAKY